MPSIVLVMNRTAPSQKPILQPAGWPLLENGYEPSSVSVFAAVDVGEGSDLVRERPAHSVDLHRRSAASWPAVQSYDVGTPHTDDEPMNEVKFGSGQAQFVSPRTVAAYGAMPPTPASVFSLIISVLLAPSAMPAIDDRTFHGIRIAIRPAAKVDSEEHHAQLLRACHVGHPLRRVAERQCPMSSVVVGPPAPSIPGVPIRQPGSIRPESRARAKSRR